MTSRLPAELRALDDQSWLDLLVRSVGERHLHGMEFPGFPSDEVQIQFVGSSNATALQRAFKFYVVVKQWAGRLANPLGPRNSFPRLRMRLGTLYALLLEGDR